jgi:hypothetical protein
MEKAFGECFGRAYSSPVCVDWIETLINGGKGGAAMVSVSVCVCVCVCVMYPWLRVLCL